MRTLIALAGLVAGLAAPLAHGIEALRLAPTERIVLDGNLDESAWARARPLDRFFELAPQDKIDAKVRTEARFAYDAQALYVAVRAHDPGMGRLRAPFARRDNILSDQDMIVLFVDPVGARKFAHFFRVNPRGSVGDGLFNEDSSSEDFSPDFEFEVVTGRFEGGWTAEFRIPFSALRYGEPPSLQWSVLVYRTWPREQGYRMASSPLPRERERVAGSVPARENSETVSLVYGHRRGIGTSFYVGASFGRVRNPDSDTRNCQTEIFAKGSWTFDVF